LGAAIVATAEWDPKKPLVDPFCGSGTIAIEAALIARRMAPGRSRSFAFQQWPTFDASAWERVVRGADGDIVEKCPPIVASDRDAGAVAATLENAARAGVGDSIEVVQRAVSDLTLPARAGWLVTNPPYGQRVGGGDIRNLYDRFGAVLRDKAVGWHVAVLGSSDTPVARLHLPLRPALSTLNGGIEVALHTGVVPAPVAAAPVAPVAPAGTAG